MIEKIMNCYSAITNICDKIYYKCHLRPPKPKVIPKDPGKGFSYVSDINCIKKSKVYRDSPICPIRLSNDKIKVLRNLNEQTQEIFKAKKYIRHMRLLKKKYSHMKTKLNAESNTSDLIKFIQESSNYRKYRKPKLRIGTHFINKTDTNINNLLTYNDSGFFYLLK